MYIALAVVLVYGARELLYMGVRMNTQGEYGKLRTLFLEHNEYNTLIIGSSRAESHFHTAIIDSITGLNCYNAGLEGATMPFVLAGYEAYLLNSKPPENLVLNIDFHAFKENNDTIHRFPRYFPYLVNEKLYERLSERDKRFPWFHRVPFYSLPYFGDRYLSASLAGYLGRQSEFDRSFVKGYAPVPEGMQQDVDTIRYRSYASVPDSIIFESLQRIIRISKQNGTKMFLVVSPMYEKERSSVLNREALLGRFSKLCADEGIVWLDMSTEASCADAAFFADPNHLNKAGSERFSAVFSNEILKYLKK